MGIQFEGTTDGATVIESSALQYKEDLSKAKKAVRIYSGECHAGLYSNELVENALKDARAREVVISICAGPILSVLIDNHRKYSGVLNLANEGVINLYARERRGNECHYRIIDDSLLRIESHHRSIEELSLRSSKVIRSKKVISQCIRQFDGTISKLRLTTDPMNDFVLLSPSEIESLKLHYLEKYPGREFSDLTHSELAQLVTTLQRLWDRDSKYWTRYYDEAKVRLDRAYSRV